MPFKFALNISNDEGTLSPENGLGLDELCPLGISLSRAIRDKRNNKTILWTVENHGYTPCFVTKSEDVYKNFIAVHRNIYEKGINDLTEAEHNYAQKLKKLLKRDTYVQPLNENREPICKIYSSSIEEVVPFYFSITSRSGIISEIGSQSLDDTSHVYLHGLPYKIYISAEQDAQLKHYYKNPEVVIDLKLKQRRSIKTGLVISAQLISYRVKSNKGLYDVLNGINPEDITFLPDAKEKDEKNHLPKLK